MHVYLLAGNTERFCLGWNEAVNWTTGYQPNTGRQTWWLRIGKCVCVFDYLFIYHV